MDSSAYRRLLDAARVETALLHQEIDKKDDDAVRRVLASIDEETKQVCLRGEAVDDAKDQPLQYALTRKASPEIIRQLIPHLDDLERVLDYGVAHLISQATLSHR